MNQETVVINLPLPSSALNAHGKTHWRKQQGPRAKARGDACLLARRFVAQGARFEKATVSYHFRFPCNRGRDLANYIQMCKPYIDGIVDAGLIPDDRWQVLSFGVVSAEIDRAAPGVSLHFMERRD
ncbi:MAG: hypothetical protein ACOC0J_02120 [Myxococcota bacterium]